jgi:hypothetical protein
VSRLHHAFRTHLERVRRILCLRLRCCEFDIDASREIDRLHALIDELRAALGDRPHGQ